MKNFETLFPVCSSVLYISCTSVRGRHKSRYVDPASLKKVFLNTQNFLAMCRNKNSNMLVTWAMVEGLSQIARGISRVGSGDSVMRRYSLTYPTIFRKLTELAPTVRYNNRCLLQSETTLDIGFDNFQTFLNKKYQRNGSSADSMHATCRLAKRSIPVLPSVGSILNCNEVDYKVVSILQSSVYASLLRVQYLISLSSSLLPWPSKYWKVVFQLYNYNNIIKHEEYSTNMNHPDDSFLFLPQPLSFQTNTLYLFFV